MALGSVVNLDTGDSYVRSDGPLVATLGVRDLIVVATPDAVLVAAKERDQDVKLIVDELKTTGHATATRNRVHRRWGFYQSLHNGERFQVKCITVHPGAKLPARLHRLNFTDLSKLLFRQTEQGVELSCES